MLRHPRTSVDTQFDRFAYGTIQRIRGVTRAPYVLTIMGMAPSLGTAVLVAALGPLAAASGVSVARADGGRACHFTVNAVIDAPLEDVHAVVAEFARYSEWFPTMRSSTRTSNSEYEVWFRLPWPIKNVRGRITVVDDINATGATIRWRQLDGDFGRNEGTWTLRSVGSNRTAIQYDNVVQFRRWVPHWLVTRAERRVAPQMIAAIQARANDRARSRQPTARASYRFSAPRVAKTKTSRRCRRAYPAGAGRRALRRSCAR